MKTLQFLLLFISALAFSQNDMDARMMYEDAEEAFANKNYKLALQKIENVENLLKKSNPKTQYLKIQIVNRIIILTDKEELYEDTLDLINQIEPRINEYLKSNPTDQQKYRDVYNIREEISGMKKKIQNKIDGKKYLVNLIANYDKILEDRGLDPVSYLLGDIPTRILEYINTLSVDKQKDIKKRFGYYGVQYKYKNFSYNRDNNRKYWALNVDPNSNYVKKKESIIYEYINLKLKEIYNTAYLTEISFREDTNDFASMKIRIPLDIPASDFKKKSPEILNEFEEKVMKRKQDYILAEGHKYWYFKDFSIEAELNTSNDKIILTISIYRYFPEDKIKISSDPFYQRYDYYYKGEYFSVPFSEIKKILNLKEEDIIYYK